MDMHVAEPRKQRRLPVILHFLIREFLHKRRKFPNLLNLSVRSDKHCTVIKNRLAVSRYQISGCYDHVSHPPSSTACFKSSRVNTFIIAIPNLRVKISFPIIPTNLSFLCKIREEKSKNKPYNEKDKFMYEGGISWNGLKS